MTVCRLLLIMCAVEAHLQENTMKPTKEQQAILEASKENQNLKVVARAGTGKSSTIRMLSKIHPEKSLYLVFNSSLKNEAAAKFDSHVHCSTMHGLAYKDAATPILHKMKHVIKHEKNYINRLRTTNELVIGLKIKDMGLLPKQRIASLLVQGMKRWEYSSDFEITKSLFSKKEIKGLCEDYEVAEGPLLDKLVSLLNSWWSERINPRRPAIAEHNTYVKIWQLSKPVLDYEIIYLDETQDLFNVFYDIVSRQEHCKIIVVGDDKQAIYQWNGAVNALDKFKYHTLPLTQSFRFGQGVADIATTVFPEDVSLSGNPAIDSVIKNVDTNKPYTAIYRTNGKLIQDAVEAINEGLNVNIEIPVKAFCMKLQAVSDFLKGKKVRHPELSMYTTIPEMIKEAEEDRELKRMVMMCNKGKTKHVLDVLENHSNSRKPSITFCTAHKSKGREWSQVMLAGDFPEIDSDQELSIPEQNLLYVAATRAIDVLQPNKTLLDLRNKRGEE